MRIWFDMTAPAHPIVFRPVIALLREAGHDVHVTARDYADTLGLLRLHGIEHEAFGRHGGAGRARKLAQLVSRSRWMRRHGRDRGFDLAVAHGSNDLALAAGRLGIPAVNMFDYEFATLQHRIGCRRARKVLTPDAIPLERLVRYGVTEATHDPFPGLKEDYYLSDFEADETVLDRLGVDRDRLLVVLRPPPDVSLYHRHANVLYPRVLDHLGRRDDVQAVVLPRTASQRAELVAEGRPSVIVPDGPVDAQSLIAFADVVVSAGGTMNREAVALGVPVYTTYAARLGAVDERLMRDGRLRPLSDPEAIDLVRREGPAGPRTPRDPGLLVEKVLSAVPA